MTTYLEISQLRDYISRCENTMSRAFYKAMIATTQEIEKQAKINARKEFRGRNDRKLTGGLLNSIHTGYVLEGTEFQGFVGTQGIPYGRIQELGGKIEPVKAKKLWLPVYKNAGKMTPREFVRLTQTNPAYYHMFDKVAARWTGAYDYVSGKLKKEYEPLFFLRDEVNLKARPYLTPAVDVGLTKFPAYFSTIVDKENG